MPEKFKSGPVLKKMRSVLGMTQKEFAQEVGVQQGYISKIETGKKDISLTRFLDLCDKFSIKPTELF